MQNGQDDMEIDLFDNAGWRTAKHAVASRPSADTNVAPIVTSADGQSPSTRGSGRGRGRGRGRGGNSQGNVAVHGSSSAGLPDATDAGTPNGLRGSGRGKPRGSRGAGRGGARGGRGGKRRRDSDEIKAEDSPSDTHMSDLEGEEYTPQATATRSGRSVQKPTSFVPPTVPSPIAGVKRKRQMHRKNPELTVCRVCLRPHSPIGNMIVFCDGCNTPYHRYCHRPAIEQVVVDEPDREWYCAECVRENGVQWDQSLFKPANGLKEDHLRSFLERVPQPVLIQLLLNASRAHPDVAIVPPDISKRATLLGSMPPPPPPTNGHSARPATPATNGTASIRPPDTDFETGYDTDPPANYPPPGQGLAATLPPESTHLSFLVDNDSAVYTHIWQRDPVAANAAVFGPTVSEAERIAELARRRREEIEIKVQLEMRRLKRLQGEEKRLRGERRELERREREQKARWAEEEEEDGTAVEDLELLDREIRDHDRDQDENQDRGKGKEKEVVSEVGLAVEGSDGAVATVQEATQAPNTSVETKKGDEAVEVNDEKTVKALTTHPTPVMTTIEQEEPATLVHDTERPDGGQDLARSRERSEAEKEEDIGLTASEVLGQAVVDGKGEEEEEASAAARARDDKLYDDDDDESIYLSRKGADQEADRSGGRSGLRESTASSILSHITVQRTP